MAYHDYNVGGGASVRFQECTPCALKPGSPELCQPCLQNREAMDTMARIIEELRDAEARRELRERVAACTRTGEPFSVSGPDCIRLAKMLKA